MQYIDDDRDLDLIDLGSVKEETKGQGAPAFDMQGGLQNQSGLSDD